MKRMDRQIFLMMAMLCVVVFSPVLLLTFKDWRHILVFGINLSMGWGDYGFNPPEFGSEKFEASVSWRAPQEADAFLPCRPQSLVRHRRLHS